MFSPFRAFCRHGGRRVAKTALSVGLLTTMASALLIVGGPAPAGASTTGSLTIDKVQVGGPALTPFSVDVDCFDIDFSNLAIDDDDAPIVIPGIPVGTVCNVTEDPAENFRAEYAPIGPVTIDADGETVTITNIFVDPGPGPDPTPSGTDLTVEVVGGDPEFELEGPVDTTFSLDPGESVTLEDIPAGVYTLTMTDLEDGLVLDGIDCDPEELSVDLGEASVTFEIAGEPITCTFTVSGEGDDDGYNQYPGDTDFEFESPFGNDDDDDPAEVAGTNNNQNGNGGQPSGGELNVAGESGSVPAPAGDVAPQAMNELPRTGTAFARLGLMAGLLMVMFGLAALLGARRRQAPQA